MQSRTFAALAAAALVAVACARTAPIYNVNDATVTPTIAKSISAAQVRSAIIAAGTGLGWAITDAGPGKLVGTLNLRTHSAVVDIPYSASKYSITYKSSTNLNEAAGGIHSNYNGWVQNLDRQIRTEIARL